jgi:hypothetical protein
MDATYRDTKSPFLRSLALGCVATAWLLLTGTEASAQQVQLARQRGPYYVGEPVVVQVLVSGLAPSEQPTCRLQGEPPAGITLQGPQVSQSSQSFTQIINGRMTSSESVDYRFSFVITADREGDYNIGPFEVVNQGATKEVEGVTFSFGKLENDPNMQISLSLPTQSVFVGQAVPVTIRWSFVGERPAVEYAFSNLQIRSPLFDQFPFKEQPRQSRTVLAIATAKGSLEVDANVTQEEQDGGRCFVVSGTLTLVPDTPGKYDTIPITCRTKKVTQWGRDLFGDLTPRGTVPALAAGTPLSFEVKPIPIDGRPASYSGAVGSGFSIDVSANRSVVRVGDPISLTLSVRGTGNLESVSMPALATNPGMSADLFQIPTEPGAGTYDGNTRQFKVNVRVKDQRVTQIPPIDFAWFDPSLSQFQTTQSKPIALQVMEAQVVSAADVVSAAPATAPGASSGEKSPASTGSSEKASAGFALVGANLAIEQDVSRLLTNTALGASPQTVAIALYALAAAVLIGGVVMRRRAQMDTAVLRKKKRLRSLRKQLASAAQRPPRDGADLIAKTLRELVAQHDIRRRADADRVISQCDDIIYATGSGDSQRVQSLLQQAQALIDDAVGEA